MDGIPIDLGKNLPTDITAISALPEEREMKLLTSENLIDFVDDLRAIKEGSAGG
jgi:hypothetical protein